jgi:glyoxylase-like metal-dependent hydrolase (beta-lactamase superfamily II)
MTAGAATRITRIDTGYVRPGLCAAYLLHGADGRAALVDCGPASATPRVLEAIDAAGVAREAVDWVLVTHVHLDHAGAAGPVLAALPSARLVVHPKGAPHMVDPTRLIAGARAVYGEAAFERDHAGMCAVEAGRVVVADDGHRVDLAGRPLDCIDTPGHANHHYSVWDAATRAWFAGDAFGLSYREFDTQAGAFAVPTTSPVQFDPDAMKASYRRLLAHAPRSIHVAHFGEVVECARLAGELSAQVDRMAALACEAEGRDDAQAWLEARLEAMYVARARRHGIADPEIAVPAVLGGDIAINAQGLLVWRARQARHAAG